MTRRVLSEDALKHIYKYEMKGSQTTLASIAGTLNISLNETAELVAKMEADGLVHTERGEISLTETGAKQPCTSSARTGSGNGISPRKQDLPSRPGTNTQSSENMLFPQKMPMPCLRS